MRRFTVRSIALASLVLAGCASVKEHFVDSAVCSASRITAVTSQATGGTATPVCECRREAVWVIPAF